MRVNKDAVNKRVQDILSRLKNGHDDVAYQALVAIFSKKPNIVECHQFVSEYIRPAYEQAIAIAKALEMAGFITNTSTHILPEKSGFSITKKGVDLIEAKQKALSEKKSGRSK